MMERFVTHACPGRCGKSIRSHLFACPACWSLLPHPMRRAITMAHNAREVEAHRVALLDALDWYREQREGAET